jgi:hypothetical protein
MLSVFFRMLLALLLNQQPVEPVTVGFVLLAMEN